MKTTDFITENEFIGDDAHAMHKDHEVQMARGDCYTAAKYAIELHKMLKNVSELDGLEGWVQEKITLANDYLRTVHEYMIAQAHEKQEPEMFSPTLAEQKLSNLLDEASYVNGKEEDPKSLRWKQTSMSYEEAVKKYGADKVRKEGKNKAGQEVIAVHVPLGESAGGMGASSVATAPGVGKGPQVGSLFGGSYSPKTPFKKKTVKKESVIKR
jgi:hypothetical protein